MKFNDTLENYTVPIPVRANDSRPYVCLRRNQNLKKNLREVTLS